MMPALTAAFMILLSEGEFGLSILMLRTSIRQMSDSSALIPGGFFRGQSESDIPNNCLLSVFDYITIEVNKYLS